MRSSHTQISISGLMFISLIQTPEVVAAVTANTNVPTAMQAQLTYQNNIPILNITNPNQAGVSMNHYQHFDIDSRGVILNNGMGTSITLLAGQVAANPNLTHPATHIVNEVSSGARIRGAVEVAGSAAHVTIATPYGIEVDNGEFINTQGVTLSGGKTELNSKGEVIHHVGKDSQIKIGRGGMRSDSQANLYARKIENEGDLLALGKLHLETGVYDLNTQTGEVRRLETEASGQAISGSGGFQGEHISIVANEKGFGVNLERVNALSGGIQIASDGTVTIGSSAAKQDIHIQAGALLNMGQMQAGQDIHINVKDTHTNMGQETAMRDNKQEAEHLHNEKGIISAGRDTSITAGAIDNEAGKITAMHNLSIKADKLDNRRGAVRNAKWRQYESSQTWHDYDAEQESTGAGEILAGHDMNLNIKRGNNRASRIQAGHILKLEGESFDNASDYLKTKDEYSYEKWKNKVLGKKHRVTDLHYTGKEEQSELSAGQGLNVKTKQFNNSGKVKAQDVEIASEELNNGIFNAGDLTSGEPLSGGEISGGTVKLSATDKIANNGYVLGDDIRINTHTLDNGKRKSNYYAIEHGDGYWVEITGEKAELGGVIASGNTLELNIENLLDRDGEIYEGQEDKKAEVKAKLGDRYQYQASMDALKYNVQAYKQDLAVKGAMVGIMVAGMMANPALIGMMQGVFAGTMFAGGVASTIAGTSILAGGQTAAMQVLQGRSFNVGQIGESIGIANVMAGLGAYTNSWGKHAVSYARTGETNMVYNGWSDASGLMQVVGNRVGANTTNALAMGAMSEIQGGQFGREFGTSMVFGLGTEAYTASVGHFADARPGRNRDSVEYKPYGDGRVERYLSKNGRYNEYNNIGLNSKDANCFFQQNGPVSNVTNYTPGVAINAIGTLHDQWMNALYPAGSKMPTWVSVGTMVPAATVTYASLYEKHILPTQAYMKQKIAIAQEYINEK